MYQTAIGPGAQLKAFEGWGPRQLPTLPTLKAGTVLIKFMPNSVPEFTFVCSLFMPNFKAIRLHIKSYSDFGKCAKRII